MCVNQPYVCNELSFRPQSSEKDNVAKITYGEDSISFNWSELNYLLATLAVLENQLARYNCTVVQFDVMTHITCALGSEVCVQPRPDASTYLLYGYLIN